MKGSQEERAGVAEQRTVDPVQVREALDVLLSAPQFRSSQQCSALLRYIVSHTLSGEENLLRERVIGADVFGRPVDYEPSTDPVVRLRASDLRKRLALYYQAEGTHVPVRITVPPGAYVASFIAAVQAEPVEKRDPEPEILPAGPPESPAPVEMVQGTELPKTVPLLPHAVGRPMQRRHWHFAAAVLLFFGVGAAFWFWWPRIATSNLDSFWAPLLKGGQAVTLCVPDYTVNELQAGDWGTRIAAVIAGGATRSRINTDASSRLPLVPYIDSVAVDKLIYWLGGLRIPYEADRSSQLTIQDLRRQPAVLVGAFDNDWSLVLLSRLRFHVQIDPKTYAEWIQDARAPDNIQWKGPGDVPYAASSVDYAIITRILEPETGQWMVAVSGLGMHGTEAAADLVTDKKLGYLLPSSVLNAKQNVQIVIRTSVIDGHNGLPQVVATESWP